MCFRKARASAAAESGSRKMQTTFINIPETEAERRVWAGVRPVPMKPRSYCALCAKDHGIDVAYVACWDRETYCPYRPCTRCEARERLRWRRMAAANNPEILRMRDQWRDLQRIFKTHPERSRRKEAAADLHVFHQIMLDSFTPEECWAIGFMRPATDWKWLQVTGGREAVMS